MDTFEWNRSKEDLLTEMQLALSDVFDGNDYTIVRNPTQGEKMNNIYYRGSNKRLAFVIPLQRSQSFTFAFNTEYLPVIKMSGAHLGELKEIKKDKYPNWKQYKNLSYSDLKLAYLTPLTPNDAEKLN